MTKMQALNRVRAVLAINTSDHRESAHKNRNLIDNAIQGERLNRECADALGILAEYERTVNAIAPRLFYEI